MLGSLSPKEVPQCILLIMIIVSFTPQLVHGETAPSCLRDEIANTARRYAGITTYRKGSTYGPGKGIRKDGWFIRDVLLEAGASVPNKPGSSQPLTRGMWKDPRNSQLTAHPRWKLVTGMPDIGDIVAGGQYIYAGVVVAEGKANIELLNGKKTRLYGDDNSITNTYWKSARVKPTSSVQVDRFGFKKMKTMTFWRYVC